MGLEPIAAAEAALRGRLRGRSLLGGLPRRSSWRAPSSRRPSSRRSLLRGRLLPGAFFAGAFLAAAFRAGSVPADHSATHSSMTSQVVPRAARPVSMPRWPPGTTSNRTCCGAGQQRHDRAYGRERRDAVGVAGEDQHRHRDRRQVHRAAADLHAARREGVALDEAVVELAEGPAGVGRHARHEAGDRLHLLEVVGVVEVGRHRQRLHHDLLGRGGGEGPVDERDRYAAERPVGARDEPGALAEVEQRPDRRHQRHLGDVDRRADHRQRGDRQVRAVGGDEQREDPAQAPPDQVHALAAGVLVHRADRLGQHLVDPVLHAERPVLEGHLPVLHEVGRPPARHQVLHERAVAAQVEAERRRGQRVHQQHRVAGLLHAGRRPVVVDLAQDPVVDERPGHRAQVGEPAVEQRVGDVSGRRDHLFGRGDQVHARNLRTRASGRPARSEKGVTGADRRP